MTYLELYNSAVGSLENSGCDSPEYEIRELLSYFFGFSRYDLSLKRNDSPDEKSENAFLDSVQKRCNGYPLQYILKSWTFMDCEFHVGEGVLIPRDDTEVCVRECIKLIDKKHMQSPRIIDLCSGSGAIAVTLGRRYPEAEIFAAELSEKAYAYLEENIRLNHTEKNVKPVKGDISVLYKNFGDGYFDVIISNPPYITTDEIPSLQKEVQFEPKLALDGGKDGLDFYRIICEKWLAKLKKGGIISLETGEDQGKAVSSLLISHGFPNVTIAKDISGLDRAVVNNE